MIETEEALRAEVLEVCRYYCLQVWNETLSQAGVEASSTLRRAESMYYPLAIRASGFLGSKANTLRRQMLARRAQPKLFLWPKAHPRRQAA